LRSEGGAFVQKAREIIKKKIEAIDDIIQKFCCLGGATEGVIEQTQNEKNHIPSIFSFAEVCKRRNKYSSFTKRIWVMKGNSYFKWKSSEKMCESGTTYLGELYL
jgi:hypothetical protein